MTISRRHLLGVIGAGSALAIPLSMKGQMGARSVAGVLADLLAGPDADAAPASASTLPLDRSLNATPAWSLDLSGPWRIAKDPANAGKTAGWFSRGPVAESVDQQLPNPLELAFPGYDGVVWYWRTFDVADPKSFDDLRIHFEGADYFAEAWLNSQYIGGNQSALLPFAFDIKKAVSAGKNHLVVRVIDACYAKVIDGFQLGNVPGGRQHDNPWEPGFRHYNYGGLMLPIAVQGFRRPWIADAFIQPDIEEQKIDVDLTLMGSEGGEWKATVKPLGGSGAVTREVVPIHVDASGHASFTLKIVEPHLWDIWDGFLYELALTPAGKGTTWRGTFGMREISILDGRIAVNRKAILQRSYLYNQIWPLTLGAPYKDLARRDIELVRKSNANMLRCFSKTPLLATVKAADELGVLLQPESLGSWYLKNGAAEDERLQNITLRAVLAYRNQPSIVWWNVLNENAPQFDPKRDYPSNEFTLGPYALQTVLPAIHALDPTRPALVNDPVWKDVDNVWEPGNSRPTRPFVGVHPYRFTGLENNEDAWETVRQRKWGAAENPQASYLASTEWGVNSSPEWARLMKSYEQSGVREDAEDYAVYRKLRDLNRHYYEQSGIRDQGFPTFESVQEASREQVAWRYREQMALYWGDLHCMGHGLTSLEDSSYELSGVVDNWRNPKPVVFDTITELNRPLQINLWIRPSSLYAGDEIGVDATLVNERQRLAAGTYPVMLRLLDEPGRVVHEKEYKHITGGEPIEHLITDSFVAKANAGQYRLTVDLGENNPRLHAERQVAIFERKPRVLKSDKKVWIWEEDELLRDWLDARSLRGLVGDAKSVSAGDLMLVMGADGAQLPAIQAAIRAGGRAVILRPEEVLHDETAEPAASDPSLPGNSGAGYPIFSDLLEPISGHWKPQLMKIDWWGSPSAWGYTRTALALRHNYLAGLPQGKALEAQPVYQRIAPGYTWLMKNLPADLPIQHAVREMSLAVDLPYTSDLFSVPCGSGMLVLTSLRLAPYLDRDPAADMVLENIVAELISGEASDARK
jgi:hypothetical protein